MRATTVAGIAAIASLLTSCDGFGRNPPSGSPLPSPSAPVAEGRYRLVGLRNSGGMGVAGTEDLVFRLDTSTGQTWRLMPVQLAPGSFEDRWILILEQPR